MDNVVLQSQDLTNTANRVKNGADELKNYMQRLGTLMDGIDNVWSDQNSKRYLERYKELELEFPKFESYVRSYGIFLDTVVETYRREFMDEVSTSVNGSN